jgi:hypothetical protein
VLQSKNASEWLRNAFGQPPAIMHRRKWQKLALPQGRYRVCHQKENTRPVNHPAYGTGAMTLQHKI